MEESRTLTSQSHDQSTKPAQGAEYVICPCWVNPRSLPLIFDFSITEDVIQSCKDLITSHFFAVEGLPTIIALHEGDHEGHLILRCAAIVAHAAMAILLRTLSEALAAGQDHSIASAEDQALSAVYRRRCRKSLRDAIKITRGLAASDFPFIDVVMAVSHRPGRSMCSPCKSLTDVHSKVCWFQIITITAELDQEDIARGFSPGRESPPPFVPPASQSPTIRNAQPITRAEQIRQQQAQYHREHQQQRGSSPLSQPPSSLSASETSRSSSASPPQKATISEINEETLEAGALPSIDEVTEELSDLQLLEKSTKDLQASFWRPVPEVLTSKMHRILEGLRVVMENQEGVYYNH